MSWLAKINLNIVVAKIGTFKSAILLIILIATCLYCGYRVGNFFHGYQKMTMEQQKKRLDELYNKQDGQIRRINTLEVELEVERIANQKSHRLLKEIEEEHYRVKKELAFYEKVMAPEKQADGLVVDKVLFTPTGSPNHFSYEVVLVQQRIKKRYAKGNVDISFVGSFNKKPKKLTLQEVSKISEKSLKFSFKYFQIFEGELTFPEGFIPDKVKLSAVMPKSKHQAYQKIDESYPWRTVIEKFN